ncbi:MAG: HepT-like ribonuclease domain-containing protein [Scytonema sp. PMC 1069.18]|nr:HepT-like ribonuclease domain-containing protein [Scytonema sp. PMC 1069.18]MEC4887133.1 HepT-like ribonuclease domain-containing protein [Scytonema sp. PMC 1070.18]
MSRRWYTRLSRNVPEQQIAGFRDVLIHDYLKVNLNRVWGVIEQNLPPLKETIAEYPITRSLIAGHQEPTKNCICCYV